MVSELAQWITPAILICGFLYLDRSIRTVRSNSRADIEDLRDRMDHQIGDLREHVDHQIGALRQHVDHQFEHVDRQIGDLRDRMGRVEGTLDALRDFIVRNGRGTAA